MSLLIREKSKWIWLPDNSPVKGKARHAASQVLAHIQSVDFPCPMSQAVAAQDNMAVGIYDTMESASSIEELNGDIDLWNSTFGGEGFTSFIALFLDEHIPDASVFHSRLWSCLGALKSKENGAFEMPEGTNDDIKSPNFSFSLHGEAYFVVGMSPTAPRFSRRIAYHGFALNPHRQFEHLRAENQMARIEQNSRHRDIKLQGSINPLLSHHGTQSAAFQYSGVPMQKLPDWPPSPIDETATS